MKTQVQLMNATTPLRQLLNRSLWRHGFLLVPLVFAVACPALAPCARATCQQGCDTTLNNTFLGNDALNANTIGTFNTAAGGYALAANTTGSDNTASGFNALISNTIRDNNTAQGSATLVRNTTGYSNTAGGYQALADNTTGYNNIGLGAGAGGNLTMGSNNIDIGNAGVAAESNIIRIGTSGTQTATFIAGIRGVGVAGGQPVGVNASGQLGVR